VTDEWSDSYDKAYALETQKKSKRYLEQVNGDLNKLN
jgi:hypothetical protein